MPHLGGGVVGDDAHKGIAQRRAAIRQSSSRACLSSGLTLLDVGKLIDTTLMTPPLVRGVKPFVDNHLRKFKADHTCAKREHIRIVMLTGQLCRIGIRTYAAPDAVDFIGCYSNSYTCPAHDDAAINSAGDYGIGDGLAVDRVISTLGAVGAEIHNLITVLILDVLRDFGLVAVTYVITADSDYHLNDLPQELSDLLALTIDPRRWML
jgi:hypothetical protein